MNSVTVIVPVYNAEVCLQRCLESVFTQKYPPAQVIVVNDGSTDGTKEIATIYSNRIDYFEHENLGPGPSRNTGLTNARGNYVAFLDADDYWLPDFLFKCVSFLEKHPHVVAVSTGQMHNLWGHGKLIRPPLLENPDSPKAPFVIDNFFSFWAEQNHVVTGSSLMRRSAIEMAGYQRTDFRMCEDLEYWGYLATFGKWGFIPEVLWVGDPTPAAASQGWMKKHKARWQELPTLEQWEKRILPRLKPDDMEGFQKVKNKVATNLVHNNILAGNLQEAKNIFMQLGDAAPRGSIMRLLRTAIRGGSPGWFMACKVIRLRERLKSNAISFSCRWFPKHSEASPKVS